MVGIGQQTGPGARRFAPRRALAVVGRRVWSWWRWWMN